MAKRTPAQGDEALQPMVERVLGVIAQAHKEKRWGEIRLTVRDGMPHLLHTEFTERLQQEEKAGQGT